MTAANPLIAQGVINRIRASVNVVEIPGLNVTAPYLGREGVSMALEGGATTFIPTMTGAVTSGEPYMMVTLTMHLLRTQGLANQYKSQMEDNSVIGELTVTPDSAALGTYTIQNCAIESVNELPFNGLDAGYVVRVRGYYLVNNNLFA